MNNYVFFLSFTAYFVQTLLIADVYVINFTNLTNCMCSCLPIVYVHIISYVNFTNCMRFILIV